MDRFGRWISIKTPFWFYPDLEFHNFICLCFIVTGLTILGFKEIKTTKNYKYISHIYSLNEYRAEVQSICVQIILRWLQMTVLSRYLHFEIPWTSLHIKHYHYQKSTGIVIWTVGSRKPHFLKKRERTGTGNIFFENKRERRRRVGTRYRFPSISDHEFCFWLTANCWKVQWISMRKYRAYWSKHKITNEVKNRTGRTPELNNFRRMIFELVAKGRLLIISIDHGSTC